MTDFLAAYQSHLESELRFHPELVNRYVTALPELLHRRCLASPAELTREEVSRIWQQQRWEETSSGIRARDVSRSPKLMALRSFLRYLEKECRALPDGVHSIIQVEETVPERLGGLTAEEFEQLRALLIHNTGTCNQRRETALIFLLCETGLTLEEALQLEVGRNGNIALSGRSGSFREKEGEFILCPDSVRKITLSANLIHYINFYLENRRHRTRRLFVKGSGRDAAGTWPVPSALRVLTRFFKQLDIVVPRGRLLDVLKATAESRQQEKRKTRQQQLSLAFTPKSRMNIAYLTNSRAA